MAEIHCRPSQYQRPSCENTGALGGLTIRPILGFRRRLISPSGTLAGVAVAEVKMPEVGESVTEGTVDKWLKHEGDFVKRDEPLVEVVTDKVNAEIPSPFEGKLVKIAVGEGETVRVGAVIAQIETGAPAAGAAAAQPKPKEAGVAHTEEPPEPAGGKTPATVAAPAAQPPDGRERQRLSPAARKLAAQENIDPTSLPASRLA